MEQNFFISALSSSIIQSIILGFIIYIAVHFIIAYAPAMKAYQRYNLFYAGVVLIFAGFILSFINASTNTDVQKMVFDLPPFKNAESVQTFHSIYFFPITYTGWIALVYLTGLFIQTLHMIAGFYRLAGIRNKKQISSYPKWDEQLISLCIKLNIHKKVGLYLGKRMFSPFTAGFIMPVIIFPIAMINRLTDEQVEAILLHELAHIKRNDYLWNIVLKVMETMLFYNPFVWMLSQSIREEREFACDDLVMHHTSNPQNYSRALLNLAESKLDNCAPALTAGRNKYELFNRIKRINTMENLNTPSKHPLFALIGIIGVCISIGCAMPADVIKTPKAPKAAQMISPAPPLAPIAPVAPVSGVQAISSAPAIPAAIPKVQAVPPPSPAAPAAIDTNKNVKYFKSDEWAKQMAEIKANASELKRKFDSREWKEEIASLKHQAEAMRIKFESPEWKNEIEKMRINAEEIKNKFNSPEWKKEVEELKLNAEKMKKKYESPEWKEEIEKMRINAEEIKAKYENLEWKQQIKP